MRVLLLGLSALWAACAPKPAPRPLPPPAPVAVAAPAAPAPAPVPVPVPKANFKLVVSETVASSDDDLGSYTKVYVDNRPAGETSAGARSQDQEWETALPAGNHLFRFEKWNLPETGDWAMLDGQYQPPERFIRVVAGQKTVVRLKFYDGGARSALRIERQPLTQ